MNAPSRALRVGRVLLIGAGTLLIAVSGIVLVEGVPVRQWPAIGLWLAGAVVLHDAVFAPLVLVGARMLRRVGARVHWLPIAVVQVALIVGGALTFVAIPGIRAQQLGARNPTVLVFPYALHLAVAWAVLGVLSAAVIVGITAHRRRTADPR